MFEEYSIEGYCLMEKHILIVCIRCIDENYCSRIFHLGFNLYAFTFDEIRKMMFKKFSILIDKDLIIKNYRKSALYVGY